MNQPIISDQDVERGIQEAQVMLKVMRLLKGLNPRTRYAVLESARLLLEADRATEQTH